jgi:hypothetical protein
MGNIISSIMISAKCDYCYNNVSVVRYQYNKIMGRYCMCNECYIMFNNSSYIYLYDD